MEAGDIRGGTIYLQPTDCHSRVLNSRHPNGLSLDKKCILINRSGLGLRNKIKKKKRKGDA